MADIFGVSLVSVRQSLQKLKALGLVEGSSKYIDMAKEMGC